MDLELIKRALRQSQSQLRAGTETDTKREKSTLVLKDIERALAELEPHEKSKPGTDVFIQNMSIKNGGLSLQAEGGAALLLADSFVETFKYNGGINYVELSFDHDDVGQMVVTLQRVKGITPCEKLHANKQVLEDVAIYLSSQDDEGALDLRSKIKNLNAL